MPILEVVHASQEPATTAQKQAFTRAVIEIFRDVLGTPDGRLKVFFYPLGWEDCSTGLLEHSTEETETNSNASEIS